MLDDFTRALHQLRSTRVDPRLQAQVLPELPPEEQTGTLVDWANQAELLNTFQLLVEDRNQMLVRRPPSPIEFHRFTDSDAPIGRSGPPQQGLFLKPSVLARPDRLWVSEEAEKPTLFHSFVVTLSFAEKSASVRLEFVPHALPPR